MNKLLRVFLNTHMGLGHNGLTSLAAQKRVSLPSLPTGEHVVFINRARTALKMYSPGNVVHYLKLPPGQKLRMETVQHFPNSLGGGEIQYGKALAASFEKFTKKTVKQTNTQAVL